MLHLRWARWFADKFHETVYYDDGYCDLVTQSTSLDLGLSVQFSIKSCCSNNMKSLLQVNFFCFYLFYKKTYSKSSNYNMT